MFAITLSLSLSLSLSSYLKKRLVGDIVKGANADVRPLVGVHPLVHVHHLQLQLGASLAGQQQQLYGGQVDDAAVHRRHPLRQVDHRPEDEAHLRGDDEQGDRQRRGLQPPAGDDPVEEVDVDRQLADQNAPDGPVPQLTAGEHLLEDQRRVLLHKGGDLFGKGGVGFLKTVLGILQRVFLQNF